MVIWIVHVNGGLTPAWVKVVAVMSHRIKVLLGLGMRRGAARKLRRSHLGAALNRRRVHLHTDLVDLRGLHLRWLSLIFLFFELLSLYKLDVLVTGDARSLRPSRHVPWCVGNLLHLQKRVRRNLVLYARILELFIQKRTVIFSWIQ